MRTALIINDVVDSVSLVAPPPDGWEPIPDHVFPGWSRTTGDWVAPDPDPPSVDELYPPLAPYQFDAILQLAGLTESLAAVLAALPDQQRIVAQAKMNRMQSYYRSDLLLNQLAAALGLTDEQVNGLWTQAREL